MKKKKGGGGANWQDTYGDMVTLLLCFFVLLYSMSSISETKWEIVVNSFRRQTMASEPGSPGQGIGTGVEQDEQTVTVQDVTDAMAQVAMALNDYSARNNLQKMMSITEGADFVFISFQSQAFFAGDSYVLLDPAKQALDEIAKAIEPQNKFIDEIRIMGHTSQVPGGVYDVQTDRFLAADRAAMVTTYLQEKDVIDAEKLVDVAYGSFRPIAEADTEEGRAKNRRVELKITGMNPNEAEKSVDKYYVMRETRYVD